MGKQTKEGTIRFSATVSQVKTLTTDGGIRVSLDMSETETETAKELMECQRLDAVLEVVILPRKP